jgi:hypothetical protein
MHSFKFAFAALTLMTSVLVSPMRASATSSVASNANEPREAWLSMSSFDGRVFVYQYIAYDATEPVQDSVKISCDYTGSGKGILLKAVDVKILISAQFTSPGAQIKRSGSVDVRQAVSDCQKALPGGKNTVKAPVAIRLPRISISSDDSANNQTPGQSPGSSGPWEPTPPIDQ